MASVICKLPNGLQVEHKGITKTFIGAADARAVAGFGVTRDIDVDWFKSWADEAKDFPPLVSGALALVEDDRNVEDVAAERQHDDDVQTGLEPLDASKPAPGIEPTDETKQELEKANEKRPAGRQRAAK